MDKISFDEAIRAQPQALRTTLQAVESGIGGLPARAADPAAILTVIAMGASTNAAEALVEAARRQGRIVLNPAASIWAEGDRVPGDWALAISESGRSPEPIEALRRVHGPSVALTNVPGSPITEAADATLSLGGVADAGVYVTGYTGTLVALALIGQHIGLKETTDGLDEIPDRVQRLIDAGHEAFTQNLDPAHPPAFIDVVADSHSYSSAAEFALLLREAARVPSAAHLTDQFLHGPAESLDPNGLLVVIGADSAGLTERFGESHHVLQIAPGSGEGEHGARLPQFAANILEVVVAQLITAHLNAGSFTIGEFRHEFSGTKLPEP